MSAQDENPLKSTLDHVKPHIIDSLRHPENLAWLKKWAVAIGPSHETEEHRVRNFESMVDHISSRFHKLLDSRRTHFFSWDPQESAIVTDRKHILDLGIPSIHGLPSLLLHQLGEPVLDEGRASARRINLSKIFLPHGRHSVLLNTAGAGKTRLVLEGLCLNWGLYFTCRSTHDSIGSSDIQIITGYKSGVGERPGYLERCGGFIPDIPLELDPKEQKVLLNQNSKYAKHFFLAAIAARLLGFVIFLEVAQNWNQVSAEDKKKLWTLVQIDTQLLARDNEPDADLFSELTNVLCHANPEMLQNETLRILDSCLKHIKSRTLHCVLDEAQTAAERLPKAFSSASTTNPIHRPVLRALLSTWGTFQLGFVITGTSLNQNIVIDALSSVIGKTSELQDGITDVGEPFSSQDVRLYMEKYLPTSYTESKPGGELIRRACYWLTGRPRFTASYIEFLLRNGFRSPHRVLTEYITHLTRFTPNDGEAWEQMEAEISLPQSPPSPFDFERIQDSQLPELANAVQRLAYYRLTSGRLSFEQDGVMNDEVSIRLVQSGFARLPKPGTARQQPVIDEPLASLAAEHWIATRNVWAKRHDWYAERFRTTTPNSNGLELYVLSCLAHIFANYQPLSEVFMFSPEGQKTGLSTRRARLVTRWVDSSGKMRFAPVSFPFQVDGSSRLTSASHILGFCSQVKDPDTENGDSDLEWLRGKVNAPFLLPLTNFGPDLMMCLQLEPLGKQAAAELIWVAIQVKHIMASKPSLDIIRKSVRSVTPSQYWRDKNGAPFAPKSYPELIANTNAALADLAAFCGPTPPPPHSSVNVTCDDVSMDDAESLANDSMEGVELSQPQASEHHPLLRVICIFPAEPNLTDCDTILRQENPSDPHDLAWLPFASYESVPGAHVLKRFKDANIPERQRNREARGALYNTLNDEARQSIDDEVLLLTPIERISTIPLHEIQIQVSRYKTIERILVLKTNDGTGRIPRYSFGPLPKTKDGVEVWRTVLLRAAQKFQDNTLGIID